jgi:hypothetical protein
VRTGGEIEREEWGAGEYARSRKSALRRLEIWTRGRMDSCADCLMGLVSFRVSHNDY